MTRPADWLAAAALGLGLLALGAAIDNREEQMTPIQSPFPDALPSSDYLHDNVVHIRPLTPEQLAEYVKARNEAAGCDQTCNQGRACSCSPTPAEAASEIGAEPKRGHARMGMWARGWLALKRWLG